MYYANAVFTLIGLLTVGKKLQILSSSYVIVFYIFVRATWYLKCRGNTPTLFFVGAFAPTAPSIPVLMK